MSGGGQEDPPRLLDEGAAAGELRSLLRAGKSEVPNAAQMLALAAKLGAIGGLGGAGAGGAGGAGAGAGGVGAAGGAVKAGLAMKVIAALAVIGVASGGVAIAVKRSGGVAIAAPVGIVAVSTASAAPSASAASSASAAPSARASAGAAGVRPVESEEAEVKLVVRAQDALRARPDEALALCSDHAKRFPSGMLVQEREVIAIEALVKTGRKDEARARANRFKARFPGSTHTRRIETILGT